jgi:hypothetical protein
MPCLSPSGGLDDGDSVVINKAALHPAAMPVRHADTEATSRVTSLVQLAWVPLALVLKVKSCLSGILQSGAN